MRVWVDLTNSPHVLVMRPLIEAMRADGHEVEVTARDFAQTLELCERFGIEHTAIGRHRGGRLGAQGGSGWCRRSVALARWARGRRFDVAMGHGSNDVTRGRRAAAHPSATAFDYEFAAAQHHVNCRLCPRGGGAGRRSRRSGSHRYGAQPASCAATPGLKEEYYLADFEPDEAVLGELGLDRDRPLVVVRTPPDVSLYHRFENPLFARVLERLAARTAQTVVLPRTPSSARRCGRSGALRRARARGGRPEPRGLRRSRDLGRRHDEPRGRGARHAGLHDLRGAARRRGRAAARATGACAGSTIRREIDAGAPRAARRRCASGETRANSSHFCSRHPNRMRACPPPSTSAASGRSASTRACSRSPTTSRTSCASTRGSRTATRSCSSDTIVLRRRDEARDVRAVRPLLEALALRRPEGLRGDPEGGRGLHGRC